jgi:hypothetical protein
MVGMVLVWFDQSVFSLILILIIMKTKILVTTNLPQIGDNSSDDKHFPSSPSSTTDTDSTENEWDYELGA